MNSRKTLRPRLAAAAASLALLGAPVLAQSAGPAERPAPVPGQSNFQRQQAAQAYATAKLAKTPRRHEWVAIRMGDRTLRAYVTWPQTKAKVPVVIVGHEVFGLTDSTRNTADEIAAMGYITIAPDMLSGLAPNGGGTSALPAGIDPGTMDTLLPSEYANAQFDAWADYAQKLPQSNGKLAIVGLSWSGGAAFRYAAMKHHPSLKVVNVFYDIGPPTSGQFLAKFDPKFPVLPVTGVDVPVYHFIPTLDTRVLNSAPATKAAMDAAGKKYEQIFLEGAEHAFFRVGEDPKNTNQANRAAIAEAMKRLKVILGAM
ncbi:dienelactone hydrolase family protein [Novosphingobium flavum]|uniref:Dienelactone hydrolase family protein n=1 Tax=Novosphingobium flavum TaxID=1778672 RepID=A0A7X1FS51_9SPHN|nr:dienelactone hydrolase family protein [Novosphingobium flavum]MBC2665844.1 dienelactone hydrolase family protein [Novosphingobium flavum]